MFSLRKSWIRAGLVATMGVTGAAQASLGPSGTYHGASVGMAVVEVVENADFWVVDNEATLAAAAEALAAQLDRARSEELLAAVTETYEYFASAVEAARGNERVRVAAAAPESRDAVMPQLVPGRTCRGTCF